MKPEKAFFNKEKKQFELNADYSLNCVSTDLGCEEHTHEYIELVYCFSGYAMNYVDGVSYLMCKGDLLLIDKNSTHAFFPMPRTYYCDIMLKPSFFGERIAENADLLALFELDEFRQFRWAVQRKKHVHFSSEDQKKVEFLINASADELKHERIAGASMNRSALCMLLTLIFRSMTEESFSVNGALLEYIKEHCDEPLTAGMLARKCFYSNEHFSRKFKKLTGVCFTRYLSQCRLEKARDLLLNTRKTVDVILVESGFTSRGEFFKKFEETFGQTPSAYRKDQKSVL